MPAATAACRAGFCPSPAVQDLAQDDFRDLFRIDLGAAQRLDDRDLAELVRRQAGEPAVEGSDRGAGGAGDDDIGHEGLLAGSAGAPPLIWQQHILAGRAACGSA